MTEHESNLHDLYAGLAMMGLMVKYGDIEPVELAHKSFDIADTMLSVREDVLKDRAEYETAEIKRTNVPNMAVSEMEEREDGAAAQGIAALKKTKARTRTV